MLNFARSSSCVCVAIKVGKTCVYHQPVDDIYVCFSRRWRKKKRVSSPTRCCRWALLRLTCRPASETRLTATACVTTTAPPAPWMEHQAGRAARTLALLAAVNPTAIRRAWRITSADTIGSSGRDGRYGFTAKSFFKVIKTESSGGSCRTNKLCERPSNVDKNPVRTKPSGMDQRHASYNFIIVHWSSVYFKTFYLS